jgi:sulfur-oxidizing protein SoxX
MRVILVLSCLCLAATAGAALAQKKIGAGRSGQVVDKIFTDGFKTAAPDWKARLVQDETQKACSTSRNAPSDAVSAAIRKREKAAIKYPDDGQLMGDWKKGETLAQSGYGWRFTDYPARQANGGNCYACHQLDKKELSYGTMGPSLAEYGKIRKFEKPAVKAVYEHIYNPQASQPCGNMPRFGTSGFLSIDQIKDLVAYVMSPDSPVNK